MANGLHVDPQVVAHRNPIKSPDYQQLTPLDWVVLDFTDGRRTFEQLISMLPADLNDLTASMIHLRLLGLLTWETPAKTTSSVRVTHSQPVMAAVGATIPSLSGLDDARRQPMPESTGTSEGRGMRAISLSGVRPAVALSPTISSYSDEVCKKYIPERLFADFRKFTPSLTDEKLDIPVEMQIFTEFLHENLSSLNHYEILCIPDGTKDKAVIKQAYMQKTKQFHPDRYFRKNIGAFAPRIAAIFKAISSAYTALQK